MSDKTELKSDTPLKRSAFDAFTSDMDLAYEVFAGGVIDDRSRDETKQRLGVKKRRVATLPIVQPPRRSPHKFYE